ncbi:MAG TPA: hypothetical protein VJ841_01095 [Candidatus Saccharimonadales bacterium]|nr:hypothetical protein [Candidatus Saccharimonadales bacterium]
MREIIFAALGAILAGLAQLTAGIVIENFKNKKRRSTSQANFALVIGVELEATSRQLDTLKTELHGRGYYPYISLNLLDTSVTRLDSNISQIYKAGQNADVQKAYVALVTDLAALAQNLRGIEDFNVSRSNAPETRHTSQEDTEESSKQVVEEAMKKASDQQFADQKRNAILVELVDIKRRSEELTDKFRQI